MEGTEHTWEKYSLLLLSEIWSHDRPELQLCVEARVTACASSRNAALDFAPGDVRK